MSLKGQRIGVENVNDTRTYKKKSFTESLKVPKKEIDINFLKKIYRDYCHSPEGQDKKQTAEENREKFKNYYIDFFLECGYAEEEIIPQLVELEVEGKVESEKVIDFDKNRNRRNKFDGRTME